MIRLVTLIAAILLATTSGAQAAPHPFRIAVAYTGQESSGTEGSHSLARLRPAGVDAFRITLDWASVAPPTRPASFDAANPADPSYNWRSFDRRIIDLRAHKVEPIVAIYDAPVWARTNDRGAASPPVVADLRAFATAAAKRYGGGFSGLPRVRYWIVWLEPNLTPQLAPQLVGGRPAAPIVYRDMINAMADAVHGVHADNWVIAGGLAPFRDITPEVVNQDKDWGPLSFMRSLFCLTNSLGRACSNPVRADIWAFHPYTSGGPQHRAQLPNDVSLGDLDKLRRVLNAAQRNGAITAPRGLRLWVTEFSWDSNPPDPCSPPMTLLKRWIPEAFYRMWANGVELVTWLQLMDDPLATSFYQSGLYFWARTIGAAKPKPFIQAFRLPFVALRRGNGVFVWAHTPLGRTGRVIVQQTFKGGWTRVKVLRTDRYGVAQAVLPRKPIGQFRAIFGLQKSLPFSMRVPKDRFFNPFGQRVLLEPNGTGCTG
jgi:hypothetical protein